MSNTYKHKEYYKWRASDYDSSVDCVWKDHRFSYRKSPSDSKTAKYIIQTLGHHRRRAAERKTCCNVKSLGVNFELLEEFDYEKHLSKRWSNIWDYD